MFRIETAKAREKYRDHCEDYSIVHDFGERTVIVIADGAGGMGAGDVAAKSLVLSAHAEMEQLHSADDWKSFLHRIDAGSLRGQTTAVVVDIRPMGIAGASVGDSQAWLIVDGEIEELTIDQIRKPLLGSGEATAVSFTRPRPLDGVLLVASDGLFDYAKREEIIKLVSKSPFQSIPRKCVELVRLPSGELWDDIVVVAARVKPPSQTRQRYEI